MKEKIEAMLKSGMTRESIIQILGISEAQYESAMTVQTVGGVIKKAVNGILNIPVDLFNSVKASAAGGWFPKTAIALTNPIWVDWDNKQKNASTAPTDDVVIGFQLREVNCKTYLSTLKGLWNDYKSTNKQVVGELQDSAGNVRNDVKLGYIDQKGNEKYPLRLVLSL